MTLNQVMWSLADAEEFQLLPPQSPGLSSVMGRAGCFSQAGRKRLEPAGTWVGVNSRIYGLNSLGDRAKEGRESERRHMGRNRGGN